MAEDYTVKKITDVAETTTADTLFIKSGGDIKQISMENLLTQMSPDIQLATLKKQMPIGYTFVWSQASGSGVDLSTAEKVAEYYGFGTWEQIKDQFLLGAGDSYAAGTTGGEAEHVLTTEEMPSHAHTAYAHGGTSIQGGGTDQNYKAIKTSNFDGTKRLTETTGSGQSHNNMPPYFAVYIWRRIA